MFEGESPDNFEQKCLCVLVLDISGSMAGEPIAELNRGLKEFEDSILADFTASQRLELAVVTFGSSAQLVSKPSLVGNFEMPTLSASGSTKLVDGMRLAVKLIEERKTWYRETGQNYYRPMIVLITDGEPDPDQDIQGLASELLLAQEAKKFTLWPLGVKGYNHQKLSLICLESKPMPLAGHKFPEFFKWLSNSIGISMGTKPHGDTDLNQWTQINL